MEAGFSSKLLSQHLTEIPVNFAGNNLGSLLEEAAGQLPRAGANFQDSGLRTHLGSLDNRLVDPAVFKPVLPKTFAGMRHTITVEGGLICCDPNLWEPWGDPLPQHCNANRDPGWGCQTLDG